MTYDELVTLPDDIAQAFILAPGYIGADSIDLETFIETVWKAPVTLDNYKAVAQSFRQWYKYHAPDEYHDPPTAEEMQAAGYDVAPHRFAHGGARPGSGRKAPNGKRVKTNVRLSPRVRQLVQWHANTRGNTFTESVEMLLLEALRDKEIDAELQKVY